MGKTNILLNSIAHQLNISQICLNARYQLLINKRKNVHIQHYNYLKAFIEYSNNMDYFYENIDEYCSKKRKSTDRI